MSTPYETNLPVLFSDDWVVLRSDLNYEYTYCGLVHTVQIPDE